MHETLAMWRWSPGAAVWFHGRARSARRELAGLAQSRTRSRVVRKRLPREAHAGQSLLVRAFAAVGTWPSMQRRYFRT